MLQARNVVLVGPMGSGKSTIGRLLAGRLGFVFRDSDTLIEERAGASISWIFDVEGEPGFREPAARRWLCGVGGGRSGCAADPRYAADRLLRQGCCHR
jgi:hypothetical protein